MTAACNHHARGGECMRHGHRALLLLAVALLTILGWTGDSWGQANVRRVGVLSFFAFADDPTLGLWFEPFRRELAREGWVEGKNVAFEYRSANGDSAQFAEAATQLAGLKVDVILAAGAPAVRAAYAATRTIPISASDFTTDPVAEGYVESYVRPGGNLTGVFLDAPEFAGKLLELLKAMVPGLSRVAVLWDPSPGPTHLQAVRNVAKAFGIKLQVLEVRKPDDIGRAFSTLRGRPQALIILPSPMLYVQSARLADLALKHRLPATSMAHAFAAAGGALAYGPDQIPTYERNAALVAKILGGAKPADLPVERPTKFKLIINLKTTKALGIHLPQSVLLRADEVIQ
jgi:putative ABC transport system substrate-binding protein